VCHEVGLVTLGAGAGAIMHAAGSTVVAMASWPGAMHGAAIDVWACTTITWWMAIVD